MTTQLELIRSALAKLGPARVSRGMVAFTNPPVGKEYHATRCFMARAGEAEGLSMGTHEPDGCGRLGITFDEWCYVASAFSEYGCRRLTRAELRAECEAYLAVTHTQAVDALLAECVDCEPVTV